MFHEKKIYLKYLKNESKRFYASTINKKRAKNDPKKCGPNNFFVP